MGAFLEMTARRYILAGLALATLSGCGVNREGLDLFANSLRSIGRSFEAPVDKRDTIDTELLVSRNVPYIFIEMPSSQSQTGMIPLREDDGVDVWFPGSLSNSVAFRDGMVIQTRGIGGDLMAADVADAQKAISQGSGNAVRVHRWLGDEDHVVSRAYYCEYSTKEGVADILVGSYPARHVTEDCAGTHESFINEYWIDRAGVVRKSAQWLTPTIGSMLIERVIEP